ncbi:unnamed protein product [Arctia plantaginis]|uniref:Ionotropic receptor n=2 Tax=Arctia plantaginis TaxID=874455 RepID=A0A8S1BMW9_ARCPL|nr:unnamed protein product [Arctia plantaginis]
MNATIHVASYYDCDHVPLYASIANAYSPVWRQTTAGCRMLEILKDMYGFNVSYVITVPSKPNWTSFENIKWTTTVQNTSIDMFLRPLTLQLEQLDVLTPIHKAYSSRLGFILQYENESYYRDFYRNPFTKPLWTSLCSMAILLSIIFYFLKKCEFRMIGGFECSYPYELLMVVGGYCQHIPPIEAKLISRRIAYLTFFFFAYTIYTYYTSNLLSHLVNDKDTGITLHSLAETHMEGVVADYIMMSIADYVSKNYCYLIVTD